MPAPTTAAAASSPSSPPPSSPTKPRTPASIRLLTLLSALACAALALALALGLPLRSPSSHGFARGVASPRDRDAPGGRTRLDKRAVAAASLPAGAAAVDAVLGYGGFAAWAWPLTREDVVRKARWRGCWDYDREGYAFEALGRLTRALAGEAALTNLGRMMVTENLVGGLCQQHAVRRYVARNPDVLAEDLGTVVVVAGQPRTGSTHLLNLLATHPNVSFITQIDSYGVVASVPAPLMYTWADGRVWYTSFATGLVAYLRPLMEKMFPNNHAFAPMEEIIISNAVFGSTLNAASIYPLDSYDMWWREADNRPALEFVKLAMQVLQHQREKAKRGSTDAAAGTPPRPPSPKKVWVLKSPQNAEFVGTIAHVFPGALHVFTHRRSIEVLRSLVPMMAYVNGVFGPIGSRAPPKHYEGLADFWVKRLAWVGSKLARDVRNNTVPRERQVHITFKEYMSDPVGTATRVLSRAGLADASSPPIRALLEAKQASSARQGELVFEYDLASFGVDEASAASLLREYDAAFGVLS